MTTTTRLGPRAASTELPPERRSKSPGSGWVNSYAMYFAAASPTDGLILVFASVIGFTPSAVAAVDGVGSIGSVLGLIVMGKVADRFGAARWLIMGLFLATAAVITGFTEATSVMALVGLSFLWGIVFQAPSPTSSVVITRVFRPSQWSDQQVRLSTAQSIGIAGGLGLSVLWLGTAAHLWGDATALRILFIIMASIAALASFAALIWLPRGGCQPQKGEAQLHVDHAPESAAHARARKSPPYNDRLKSMLLVALVMYVGVGMLGTILPIYLTQQLGAKSYVAMAGTLASVLAVSMTLPLIGRAMARLPSLRLFVAAAFLRGGLMLLIPCMALLLPLGLALIAVVIIMAGIGVCSTATTASFSTRLVSMAPTGRKGGVSGQYSALQFTALAGGSFLGGLVAQHYGFFPAFGVAAGWLMFSSILALRF